jgi:transposase
LRVQVPQEPKRVRDEVQTDLNVMFLLLGGLSLIVGALGIAVDSGEKTGERHIRGGRSFVRRALYMAALTAATWNHDLKAFYRRLRQTKEKKVALTAVIRKLVVLANTLIKEDRLWQPVRP